MIGLDKNDWWDKIGLLNKNNCLYKGELGCT